MEVVGKAFRIKSSEGSEKFLSVLSDTGTAYHIHLVTHSPWGIDESNEALSKDLFQTCIRTGYLVEIEATSLTFAS